MIMKKLLIHGLMILILGFIPYSVYASEYVFTAIDVPGARFTEAYGISGTNIVGDYIDASDNYHGFLYNVSTHVYTTIDMPGVGISFTGAYGIDGNNIVGEYDDAGGIHGFLYNGSTYTTIDIPDAMDTYALGIDGNNIVGDYSRGYFTGERGLLYNGNTYTKLNVAGAMDTCASGISGSNIVGFYSNYRHWPHGFVYNGKTCGRLDVPGAMWTEALGIDGNNIVGAYQDANGNHGFLVTLPDTTRPVVTAFIVSSPSTSLTVSITNFTATDNVEVTGYMVTTSFMPPSANSSKWSVTSSTGFTFPSTTKSGTKTLYAWAKDAAGNVSKPLSAKVTINLLDVPR